MTQSVVPMLSYRNGAAAMDWLVRTFGFTEQARYLDDHGLLLHGELLAGDDVVMLATPSTDYEGPSMHRAHCPSSDRWLSVPWIVDGVLVYVEDVATHCRRSKEAGASLLSDIEEDSPGTRYRVEDLEGHRWMFMERPVS